MIGQSFRDVNWSFVKIKAWFYWLCNLNVSGTFRRVFVIVMMVIVSYLIGVSFCSVWLLFSVLLEFVDNSFVRCH